MDKRSDEDKDKKTKIYSYSRLSTFEQCPYKFKLRYIDKIIPKIEKSIEAHLGSSVHLALEWLYTQAKQGVVPSVDDLIVFYNDAWLKDYSKDFISPSMQPHQHYFDRGVEFLVMYYLENKPFDDNTIELEKKIVIDLDEGGSFKIQGFIDRLVYNLKTDEYEIHDYKTANSPPTEDKIKKDRQLALYSIAIKDIYGKEKEVNLIWHFLAYNKRFHLKKTNDELDILKKETLELIKKIEDTKEFTPNKSRLCEWCEYRDICPVWANEKKIELKSEEEIWKEKHKDIDRYPTLRKYIRD